MSIRNLILCMCGAALLGADGGRAAAQVPGYRARLDSLFTILETHDRMMGSVTVRRAGRVIYQRTVGFRDSTAAGRLRADSATMYRIGSVTKPFTAALVYQLVDERRVTLDTKLARFFPGLPAADSVTIRNLLGHTSGIPDYLTGMDPMVRLECDSLLRRIAAQPRQFAVGTRRRYSNSNYLLLGYIVEALTGSSYGEQLQRRIARRAGLRRTRFAGEAGANEARSYFFSDGRWTPQPAHVLEHAGGAGGIVSTPSDVTRFLSALFERRLISPASLREMKEGFVSGTTRSGKGLSPFSIPGTTKTGFSHDGSIGAFSALAGYVPEDSLALALTINGNNYPQNRIFFHVWDILYGGGKPLPSFAPVALAEGAEAPLVGVYSAEAYGVTITIRRTAAGMEAQTTGQDPFPIKPIGQNRFVNTRDGILIEFAEPVGGASPRFTLYQQMVTLPLVRTTPK
ncbi:MAG TPA: serine hydrolase domain-containing protein [Longimicrobium sp.]